MGGSKKVIDMLFKMANSGANLNVNLEYKRVFTKGGIWFPLKHKTL